MGNGFDFAKSYVNGGGGGPLRFIDTGGGGGGGGGRVGGGGNVLFNLLGLSNSSLTTPLSSLALLASSSAIFAKSELGVNASRRLFFCVEFFRLLDIPPLCVRL